MMRDKLNASVSHFRIMFKREAQSLLLVGFTAVFSAYFLVWLPGPAAGLRFIGLELGEWVKFLGMGSSRNWFYAPPITLGLMLAVLTVSWSNARWQTWAMRGLAAAVSLLAFPAYEDITGQFRHEYMPRVGFDRPGAVSHSPEQFIGRETAAASRSLAGFGFSGAGGCDWAYLVLSGCAAGCDPGAGAAGGNWPRHLVEWGGTFAGSGRFLVEIQV